jgi:hypothetical protein
MVVHATLWLTGMWRKLRIPFQFLSFRYELVFPTIFLSPTINPLGFEFCLLVIPHLVRAGSCRTTKMASWHQTSCTTPDVFAEGDGETLRCRSCNIGVQVRDLIAQQANQFSPITIPQDEPVGEMNLWWPPGVPYSRESHAEQQTAGNSQSGSTAAVLAKKDLVMEDSVYLNLGKLELSKVLPHEDSPSPPSTSPPAGATQIPPVYGATLAIDEFRLLCLYAADDVNSPIHITLEVFRHDDCPEYETVSYTWGCEDGDSTPCRPIFVGPYWDILLQTKNCWDMLRYMRPWRGIRMVWVDAICINQNDAVERAQQVAKMGAIYQSCSRVFVYLGSDIVSADGSKRHHPSHRGLHEFDQVMNGNAATEGATTTTLQKMLTRRYFSRVWVIQELVLSRNAVIPVGGVQFWASNLTPKYLASSSGPDSSPWDWNSTVAPWMQFIGGTSFDEDGLYQILRRTWQSKASDPRDKLFGILGLLRSQTNNSLLAMNAHFSGPNKLAPNYQISTLHAFIGFFAHILINLGVADVLMNASGPAALPGYPSWVPDWQARESLKGEDDVDETYTMGIQSSDVRVHASSRRPRDRVFCTSLFPLSLQPSGRNINGNEWNFNRYLRDYLFERLPQDSWGKRRESDPKLYDMNSWRRTASIDFSTGALSIKLHHLFQFNASPVRTEVADLYEVLEEPCALYIMTQKGGPLLDTLVPPGRNHLFYLEKEEGDPGYLLLFLQELDCKSFSPRKSFKLLLCCAYADIFLLSPLTGSGSGWMFTKIYNINLQLSLHTVISEVQKMMGGKEILEGGLYDALKGYNANDKGRGMRQMFPWRGIALSDVLRVFQGYLNESRHQKPNFLEAYFRCLNERLPQCQMKVTVDDGRHGWIELTLTPQDWAKYEDHYLVLGYHEAEIRWEWRYASAVKSWLGKKWKSCEAKRWGPWKPDEAVSVRARITDFIKNIESTDFYWELRRLSFAAAAVTTAGTSEDEVTMLMRGPRWEDHFVPCRKWSQELIDSFAADGVPWQVWIL